MGVSAENKVQFAKEVKATEELRERYPAEGQRTLARRIKEKAFSTHDSRKLAEQAGLAVPEATVYNRIRRFDARRETPDYPQFNVGDQVKVTQRGDGYNHTRGFDNSWVVEMDRHVGRVLTVKSQGAEGVRMTDSEWTFPPQVLVKVGEESLIPA